MRLTIPLGLMCTCLVVGAQTPSELDLQNLKQYVGAPQNQQLQQTPDPTPNKGALTAKVVDGDKGQGLSKDELQARENAQVEAEIKGLKAKDKGPRRFASDLFDTRQSNPSATTEGGISEDYVLGTGDSLAVNVFGSATFDVPAQVDGRGEIVIPKVGSVKVAGLTLGKAKQAVQGLVGRQFSRTTVDLQVMKLREVRIFVLGEVSNPGAFPYNGEEITIPKAIAAAHGFDKKTAALQAMLLVRWLPKENGYHGWKIDANPDYWSSPNQIFLQPGDVLYVPNTTIDKVDIWVDQYIRQVIPFPYLSYYIVNQPATPTN